MRPHFLQERTDVNPNMTLGGLLAPWPEDPALQFVARLRRWEQGLDGVWLDVETDQGEGARVRLQAWAPEVMRLTLLPEGVEEPASTPLLITQHPTGVHFQVAERDAGLELRTDALRFVVQSEPFEARLYDRQDAFVCGGHRADTNLRGWPRNRPLGYRRADDGHVTRTYDSFFLAPDEALYGLGERFMPLNRRGHRLELWNFNTWGASNERAYKNIPLLLSSRGYGLFFHTTFPLRCDLGSGALSSISSVIESEAPHWDLFYLYGPDLAGVLARYTALTGRAPVPPRWSFGLWMSRAAYHDRQEVEDVAARLRTEGVACDVLHLDGWMRAAMRSDLIWDEDAFPRPAEMIAGLKAQGYRVSLWLQPWIPQTSEVFQEAVAGGHFATHEDGSIYLYVPTIPWERPTPSGIIDFSNPAAVRWYQEKLRRLIDQGVDAFKTDFGEAIPEDARFYNGMTGREMHNLYPLLYNAAVYGALEGVRPGQAVVWARSAWAGSQRYPVHWSGDQWADFPNLVTTLWGGLSFGLSGVPFWSHDLGGFFGPSDPELYVRWAQFGLLCSHARCHGTSSREPWTFGEEALAIFRRYVRLRYRLIPYLYSYAHVAHATGLPLVRAMALEFQDDPTTHNLDLQYMLGRELLAAPVYERGAQTRRVYLPAGLWLDFWTHEEHQGPGWVVCETPLDRLPLFLRGDAILPLGPEMDYVGQRPVDPLTLHIYVQGQATFTLHDEDETLYLSATRGIDDLLLHVSPSRCAYRALVHHVPEPREVQLNGTVLPRLEAGEAWESADRGWWYDPRGQLHVRFCADGERDSRVLVAR